MELSKTMQSIHSWEGILLKVVEVPNGNFSIAVWRPGRWETGTSVTWDKWMKSPEASVVELAEQGLTPEADRVPPLPRAQG